MESKVLFADIVCNIKLVYDIITIISAHMDVKVVIDFYIIL